MGGRCLKLHHKSHPERKHDVTPPPFSNQPSPLSPLWPSPILSPVRLPPLPLFLCTESAPWMDQVYFILLLHVLQKPNSPVSTQPLLSSSTSSPPLLFPLLHGYKSLTRPAKEKRNMGGRWLKHKRQGGRKGRISWDESVSSKEQPKWNMKTIWCQRWVLSIPCGYLQQFKLEMETYN